MKKFTILLLIISIGCSKGDTGTSSGSGGGGGTNSNPTVVTEENIAFSIDIDPGSSVYAAVGANQNAVVNVTSALPKDGIVIDLLVSSNSDNAKVWTNSVSSVNKTNTIVIDSLKPGILCTAKFTVTSKTKSTNTLTKTFSIVRK